MPALIHPLIIGELACGNLKNREVILDALNQLPRAQEATLQESLDLIEDRKFFGKDVGIVDIQLFASALLRRAELFTTDKRLQRLWTKS